MHRTWERLLLHRVLTKSLLPPTLTGLHQRPWCAHVGRKQVLGLRLIWRKRSGLSRWRTLKTPQRWRQMTQGRLDLVSHGAVLITLNAAVYAPYLSLRKILWPSAVAHSVKQLNIIPVADIQPRVPRGQNLFVPPVMPGKYWRSPPGLLDLSPSTLRLLHCTAATAQAQGAMIVGAVSGAGAVSGTKCLCDHYSFCENCLNLQSLARRLTESLNATRKENQALNLHILKLEERIQALDRSAKPIERLEAIERDVSNLKATLFPPSSQGTSWARVAGRRQPRGSRPPPTSAPSMRNPTSASASTSSGQASRRSSGNRRRF